MIRRAVWPLLAVLLWLATEARGLAQERAQERAEMPRVLLLCDQSFQNHAGNTAKALKDGAEVVRSPLGYLSTGAVLERIDEVLGEQSWDLICFNCGLSDLMCRDPRTRKIRAMSPKAGGVPVTELDRYEKNLELLVERLRAQGAIVLWMSTMPVHPQARSGAIVLEAIGVYNQRASAVMSRLSVALVDTHAQVQAKLDEVENPRNLGRVHNDLFKTDLSGPLVAAIRERVGDGG